MPMTKEEHEELLNALLNGEIEHSQRADILQRLRVDYASVHSDFETLTTTNEKLKANNEDLVVSNSQLFRQLGIVGGGEEMKEKEEKKTFSETITLEDLEK